jgi:hypothetical protein
VHGRRLFGSQSLWTPKGSDITSWTGEMKGWSAQKRFSQLAPLIWERPQVAATENGVRKKAAGLTLRVACIRTHFVWNAVVIIRTSVTWCGYGIYGSYTVRQAEKASKIWHEHDNTWYYDVNRSGRNVLYHFVQFVSPPWPWHKNSFRQFVKHAIDLWHIQNFS